MTKEAYGDCVIHLLFWRAALSKAECDFPGAFFCVACKGDIVDETLGARGIRFLIQPELHVVLWISVEEMQLGFL
jgi:hypothetical protein